MLKDNNNGIYEDIINNKIFNKNDIVEYYSAVPYFVQTDNVKSKYTKARGDVYEYLLSKIKQDVYSDNNKELIKNK